ncbi:hypothetical protein FB451DRAFT_1178029 [Mycena latifolia]|nr:hypothetical protein FB451DRAFT_1178029 [Mycena latifolia]
MAQAGELDAAITRFMQADDLLAFYDPQRPTLLANWAVALRQRSLGNAHPVDLDASIERLHFLHASNPVGENQTSTKLSSFIARHSLSSPPRYIDAQALQGFAQAYDGRFKLKQQLTDANLCIDLLREALSPIYWDIISDLDRGQSLAVLGTMLHARFSRLGDEADLDAAIRSNEESAYTSPSIGSRFHLRASPDDIQQAVALIRQALASWPMGRPEKDSCIENAATILHERFIFIGDPADLDQSITLHRDALELCSSPHPERYKSLGNLANTLVDRFRLDGRTVDATEAAELYSSALSLSKQDTRNLVQNNVSGFLTLLNQADMAADSDGQEAVCLAQAALDARPQNHPERVTAMNNLAVALRMQFNLHHEITDLDQAIELLREGLINHHGAHRPLFLHERYVKTGQQHDLDAMRAHCEELQTQWADYSEGRLHP